MRTRGYQGTHRWSAKVNTNDSKWNAVYLEVKALVNVPISLSSRWVYLRGDADQIVTRRIDIRARLDKPLTLTPKQFNLEGKVKYRVEEVEKGRKFRIRFSSIPGPPQNYSGLLTLETNYPEKPSISIKIKGRFVQKKKPGG